MVYANEACVKVMTIRDLIQYKDVLPVEEIQLWR